MAVTREVRPRPVPWRFGFSAYPTAEPAALRDRSLALCRAGFAAMEVFAVGDVAGAEAFSAYTAAIRTVVAESGVRLSVHLPTTDCNPLSRNRRVRRAAVESQKAGLAWAAALGAELAVVHLGSAPVRSAAAEDPADTRFGGMWAVARSILRELALYAGAAGVALTVENLIAPNEVPTHPGHLLELVDHPDADGVGVTVDLSHARLAGWDPAEYLRRVGPRLRHVHANDTDGAADRHWPPGRGSVAWAAATEELRRLAFDGTVVLEVDAPVEVLLESRALLAAEPR